MSKPPLRHPFSTNTGQIMLTRLVASPRSSLLFTFGASAAGIPVSPILVDSALDELVLLVYAELAVIASTSSTTVPSVPTINTIVPDTLLIPPNEFMVLQWPSKYFTAVPIVEPTDDKNLFVSVLNAQNAFGDAYKTEVR